MVRVYGPDVATDTGRVEIHGDEAHHLTRVMRARTGDRVLLFNGRGREWQTRVVDVGRQSVTLELESIVAPVMEPLVKVTLAVGVLKGDQMDTVVRDATVMGVSTIVPIATDHVTVPSRAWRDDGGGGRWHRVAVAAAKQCGRAVVPVIAPVSSLAGLWATATDAVAPALTLVCVEPAAVAAAEAPVSEWRVQPRPASALVLVGPEGGWSPAELEWLAARGALPVSLGPRTLRAETVPTVALTMLWATWGWS